MENERKIYEIGYLLTPLVSEENLAEEAGSLRKLIEDRGGFVINEGQPKTRRLAYPIAKMESAYFGWLKFMASPETIGEIKTSLEKLGAKIIRFLITGAVKEEMVSAPVKRIIRKKKVIPPEIKEGAKFEEIDKKLEELLANQ